MKNSALIDRLRAIVIQYYINFGKTKILQYEQLEGRHSRWTVEELRDAFDHLALSLLPGRSDHDIERDINGMFEHLRRAIIEPYEAAAEQYIYLVDKQYWKSKIWSKLLFVKIQTRVEIESKKVSVLRKIIEGRGHKGDDFMACATAMEVAYNEGRTLYRECIAIPEFNERQFLGAVGLITVLLTLSGSFLLRMLKEGI